MGAVYDPILVNGLPLKKGRGSVEIRGGYACMKERKNERLCVVAGCAATAREGHFTHHGFCYIVDKQGFSTAGTLVWVVKIFRVKVIHV